MADEITLLESFDHGPQGWRYYDTYDPLLRDAIHDQRHINLRDFLPPSWANSDRWSAFVMPGNLIEGNLPKISVNLDAGVNDFDSFRWDHNGDNLAIDMTDGFDDDAHLSIAMPSFPLSSINLAASYVRFTTEDDYSDLTKTATINFDSSLVPLVNGNSEFRILLGSLRQNSFDLTKMKGVFFHIVATAPAELIISGLRVMDPNWSSGGFGMNTLNGTLVKMANRVGVRDTDFDQPILWHASEPTGTNDPRPIDADFVIPFRTSMQNAGTNRISLYFREVTEDFMTQLDLNGMTMAELNGRDQPNIGAAKYNQRTIEELGRYRLSELEGETMFSLERTPDYVWASWIEFTLQWGTTNGITIQDTEGNGYNFALPPLEINTNYAFATFLEENKARAVLYRLHNAGGYLNTVFDTTMINDDTSFRRRKGRMGWYAALNDGDARILSIAPNGVTYAEFRSHPNTSQTPVVGAELFASNSPSNELFQEFQVSPDRPSIITKDTSKSLSGESWKFNVPESGAVDILTQPLVITDYPNSIIEFDIFLPADAVAEGSDLRASVHGQHFSERYDLVTPTVYGDQWQRVRIDFLFGTPAILPGRIQVMIGLDYLGADKTFWIDNMSVRERTVVWDGRAVVDDPWKSNDAAWQPFRDNYARENGGIVFDKRGSNLQVRGRAREQNATISRVQYKPRYAELGRITVKTASDIISHTNEVPNPSGTVNTSGWADTGDGSGTITAVTDDGAPALQNSKNSYNTVLSMTYATTIPFNSYYRYYLAAEARKVSTPYVSEAYLDYMIWSDDGTHYLSGRYGQSGMSPQRPDFGDYRSPMLFNNYGLTETTLGWFALYGVWTVDTARIAQWATVTGKTYNSPRIGLSVSFIGGSPPTPTISRLRKATLVAMPPGNKRLPPGPFDGTSSGARWTAGAPSKSIIDPAPTSEVTLTFTPTPAGSTVSFVANANKPIINHEWNFGDGNKGLGKNVSHTYDSTGLYPVTLVATDSYGNQGTYTQNVAVS